MSISSGIEPYLSDEFLGKCLTQKIKEQNLGELEREVTDYLVMRFERISTLLDKEVTK